MTQTPPLPPARRVTSLILLAVIAGLTSAVFFLSQQPTGNDALLAADDTADLVEPTQVAQTDAPDTADALADVQTDAPQLAAAPNVPDDATDTTLNQFAEQAGDAANVAEQPGALAQLDTIQPPAAPQADTAVAATDLASASQASQNDAQTIAEQLQVALQNALKDAPADTSTDTVNKTAQADQTTENAGQTDLAEAELFDQNAIDTANTQVAALDDTALDGAELDNKGTTTVDLSTIGLDLVRIEQDGAALVAGFAPAGQQLALIVEDTEIARSTADGAGRFVSLFDIPVSDQPRSLSLGLIGADGEMKLAASQVLISPVRVELEPDLQDTVNVRSTQDAVAPTIVTSNASGVNVVQAAPQPVVPGTESVKNIVIDTIAYDRAGEVELTGRSGGDGFVRVYLDDIAIETAPVGANGTWSVPLLNVDAGIYRLRVDELDAEGAVISRIETPFQRENQSLAADASGSITVQPGFTLWAIAQENLGSGFRYVQVYEANRDLIRDPDLIYPGQVFAMPGQG